VTCNTIYLGSPLLGGVDWSLSDALLGTVSVLIIAADLGTDVLRFTVLSTLYCLHSTVLVALQQHPDSMRGGHAPPPQVKC
jgi:hypothetical protein